MSSMGWALEEISNSGLFHSNLTLWLTSNFFSDLSKTFSVWLQMQTTISSHLDQATSSLVPSSSVSSYNSIMWSTASSAPRKSQVPSRMDAQDGQSSLSPEQDDDTRSCSYHLSKENHVPTPSLPLLSYPLTCLHIHYCSTQHLLHLSLPLRNLFIISMQVDDDRTSEYGYSYELPTPSILRVRAFRGQLLPTPLFPTKLMLYQPQDICPYSLQCLNLHYGIKCHCDTILTHHHTADQRIRKFPQDSKSMRHVCLLCPTSSEPILTILE